MSKAINKIIIVIALAGILLTPACSPIDEVQGSDRTEVEITNDKSTETPKATKEPIQVISTEEELEEYFNSITDEEIEELFRIIESIDISEDIDLDKDPGFDQIIIP